MSVNPAKQTELESLLAISSGLNSEQGNERFKAIMHQVLSDLCQTIKKFDISDEEFWLAVNYLNELGERKESALLAAGLGLEHYLDMRADEKEAAGPALGKDGLCAGQLVGTAIVVVDRRRIAARLQTGLQLVQQVRKQSVLRALYNEGQPLRHLLLQMLGIGVGLVAVLRHNGQYFPACVLADAGVVVQHAGHG